MKTVTVDQLAGPGLPSAGGPGFRYAILREFARNYGPLLGLFIRAALAHGRADAPGSAADAVARSAARAALQHAARAVWAHLHDWRFFGIALALCGECETCAIISAMRRFGDVTHDGKDRAAIDGAARALTAAAVALTRRAEGGELGECGA